MAIEEGYETDAIREPVPYRSHGPLAFISRFIGNRWGFALALAVLFVLSWVSAFVVLSLFDKSIFWSIDGLSQQYAWFVYAGQWMREALSSIFIDHTFEIPLWTMDSGFGLDTVQALICIIVNPVYLVSVFVPESAAEYVFTVMIYLCIYAGGLAFSLWAIARGTPRSYALLGALCYITAGNIISVYSQPGFTFPVLAFPLVLWAADRVFAHKSPLPFILLLTWTVLFSFYDAYMILILLVLYCIVTFFARVDKENGREGRGKRFVGWLGRFVLYVVLALLIACIFFLPEAMSVLGSSRLSLERTSSVFYEPSYYINFIMGFTSYASCIGGDAYTGLFVLAPLMVIALVMYHKKHRALLISFIVLTVMMLLPIFGSIMNFMAYPTGRWSWAYSLCGAYALACVLPDLMSMKRRNKIIMAVLVGIYVVLCLVLPISGRIQIIAVLLAVAVVACFLAQRWGQRCSMVILAAVAVVAASVSFYWYIAPDASDAEDNLVDAGQTWASHEEYGVAGLIEQAEESSDGDFVYDETYRYDRAGLATEIHNSNLITGYMGIDFYNSIYNDGVDELLTSLGVTGTEGANNRYSSLSSRSLLDALLGVRYYYISDDASIMLPYTFRNAQELAEGEGDQGYYRLYETDEVLPLAFTLSSYITRDAYYALPVEARQEALMQALVLTDAGIAELEEDGIYLDDVSDSIEIASVELPFEVVDTDGLTIDGTTVIVTENDAVMDIAFDGLADAETYICMVGMDYRNITVDDIYAPDEWESMSLTSRLAAILEQILKTRSTIGYITLEMEDYDPRIFVYYPNSADPLYGGKHDWVINMGYSEEGLTGAMLTFNHQGVYTFDELYIACLPMEGVDETIAELQTGSADDITIGTNRISATATTESDTLLFFSVAVSDGWTAYVDGEKTAILEADLGFMAVPLTAGTHVVELRYCTPYLPEGAILSGLGILATVVVLLVRRHHRHVQEVR